MIQLQLLNGARTGTVYRTREFPTRIGRDTALDISLDDPGVWQRHASLDWRAEGIIIEAEPDTLVSVNDLPVKSATLRNGDIITLGALKMRFNFAPVRQYSLIFREWGTWIALTLLCLVQIALVYSLLS